MPGKVFNPIKGVFSFNGRKGIITPDSGDYTAEMVGAAPDGFGLGATLGGTIPGGDANNAINNGWYSVAGTELNLPTAEDGVQSAQHALLFVQSRRADLVKVQTIILGTASYQGYVLRRVYSNATAAWSPYEWVNPPVQLGVEYRTTERYNENPVYARLVNVGPFPSPGTHKEVSIETGHSSVELVSCSFKVGQWEVPTTMFGGTRDDTGIVEAYGRTSGSKLIVYLYTKQRDLSSINVLAYFKYTVEDS